MPLLPLEIVLALISMGLGTLLPVSTVSIQNAVQPHELGTATGTANFSRSLGGALIVALFGAIIVAGTGGAGRGGSMEDLASVAARSGADLATVFQFVFGAALVGFVLRLRLPARDGGTAVARQRGPGRRRGDRRLNLPTDVETCNREVTAGPNLDPRARAAIASRSRARTLSIVVVRQSARALRGPWGALLRAADALIP